MQGFTYTPQYTLGVATNLVNVTNVQGKMLGYLEAKDVPAFNAGDVSLFEPVKNWKQTFSVSLQKTLGLYRTDRYIPFYSLKPLKGKVDNAHSEIRKLTRPYTPITEEQFKKLIAAEYDYYKTPDDLVVTFGVADGGFALMPLNAQGGGDVLARQ